LRIKLKRAYRVCLVSCLQVSSGLVKKESTSPGDIEAKRMARFWPNPGCFEGKILFLRPVSWCPEPSKLPSLRKLLIHNMMIFKIGEPEWNLGKKGSA
jgi:hypothetical protein